MAVAAITVTVTEELPLIGRGVLVFGTLAVSPSADTYAAGGLVLDKTRFRGKLPISVEANPRILFAKGKAGYDYEYDRANGKLKIRDFPNVVVVGGQAAGAALQILPDSAAGVLGKVSVTTQTIPGSTFGFTLAELPAVAIPAAVSNDVIEFLAIFDKFPAA